MARACCALVVADLIMGEWALRAMPVVALAAPRPSASILAESLAVIHIRRGLSAIDRASVALENARLSARGSIRRAHGVITWVGTLRVLQNGKPGLDASAIIKRYKLDDHGSVPTRWFEEDGMSLVD